MSDVTRVFGHNLFEFCCELEKAVLEGYTVSDKNEYYPQRFGGLMYEATLVKNTERNIDIETDWSGFDKEALAKQIVDAGMKFVEMYGYNPFDKLTVENDKGVANVNSADVSEKMNEPISADDVAKLEEVGAQVQEKKKAGRPAKS